MEERGVLRTVGAPHWQAPGRATLRVPRCHMRRQRCTPKCDRVTIAYDTINANWWERHVLGRTKSDGPRFQRRPIRRAG